VGDGVTALLLVTLYVSIGYALGEAMREAGATIWEAFCASVVWPLMVAALAVLMVVHRL
jgi:membrane protein DedA with SNARE-associated domain